VWTYRKYLSVSGITIDQPNLIPHGTLLHNVTNRIGQIEVIVRTGRTFDAPTTFDRFFLPQISRLIMHLDTEFLGYVLCGVQVLI
jgi:hypothetical protein